MAPEQGFAAQAGVSQLKRSTGVFQGKCAVLARVQGQRALPHERTSASPEWLGSENEMGAAGGSPGKPGEEGGALRPQAGTAAQGARPQAVVRTKFAKRHPRPRPHII